MDDREVVHDALRLVQVNRVKLGEGISEEVFKRSVVVENNKRDLVENLGDVFSGYFSPEHVHKFNEPSVGKTGGVKGLFGVRLKVELAVPFCLKDGFYDGCFAVVVHMMIGAMLV